ncbi:hypothetical protein KIH74_00440 [Kineosporia sp. J2-2]|uniref:Rv3660c-like CheY-like N-terminal domain-containing protein n=1 Tax=Kineosporia corallincola TaxID=2835133 RepID=A0ABS5T8H7_9ACTN|nr:septum site-determining protein Ssd [Kineosporia corallincola]MBT0767367.1 hypothetical protein [Kineosporia corallincola]
MASPWVLLLTSEPLLVAATGRLAAAYGVPVRTGIAPGAGPPGLVLVGSDHAGALPGPASGVPRLLLAAGTPGEQLWRTALELRAEQVVLLPEGEHLLAERLSRLDGGRAGGPLTFGVVGGCGGAGASVLAAALARTAALVTPTLLVEVDPFGGGADLLLGAEHEPGLRWPDLASARGLLLPGSLSGALPLIDGVHVLAAVRGSSGELSRPSATAVAAVLDSSRGEYGTVVVDIPRHPDEAVRAALRALDVLLVVVPAEVRATAAAQRVAAVVRPLTGDVRVVVRGPAPTGLSASSICTALDLPLAGVLRAEPGLRVALDRGEPPGLRGRSPLSRFCRELLAQELPARELPAAGLSR